jgi:hypothetical protein
VFVALVIRNAIHMHRIVLSSMACVALQNVSTLSQKWNYFREEATEHKMCFDFLCKNLFKTFRYDKLAKYYNKFTCVCMSSTRYSCQTLIKLEFSRQIFATYPKSNFMKIRPVVAELFHANIRLYGQTAIKI